MRWATIALLVLAVPLAAAALILSYVRSELADRDAFADRAVSALASDPVRSAAAEEAVDGLVGTGSADLLAVRPLLTTAIDALLDTDPAREVVRLAARDAQGLLLSPDAQPLVLDLDDAAALVVPALRSVSPAVARAVPANTRVRLFELDSSELELGGARRLVEERWLAPWLIAAAGLALLGAVALAGDRRRGLAGAGIALAAAGALVALLVEVGRARLLAGVRNADSTGAIYDAFAADLRDWGLVMLAAGIAVAVVAVEAIDPALLRTRAEALLRAPGPPALRVARGTLAVALGGLLIVRPDVVVAVAGPLVGVALAALGLGEVAAALERRGRERARTPAGARAVALGAAVALVLVAGGGSALATGLLAGGGESDTKAPAKRRTAARATGCLGSSELCDRRLNEVVLPATHNSFSAALEPGWLFANQRFGIEQQLQDGIRGFLLDVHLGVRDGGQVRTDLRAEGVSRNRAARRLSPQALAIAERLAGRVGLGRLDGPRDLYLCHSLCELGAEPFVEQLAIIRRYLDAYRGEIVVLLVEPYVATELIESAFRRAGLANRLAVLRRSAPLPTLGELVAANRRVVVFTERDGGARRWYHDQFSYFQETPLGATDAGQFSCARGRGDSDAPLFALNHWIDRFPPPPTANARAGRRAVLEERARRCMRERRLLPNLIAVDYYDSTAVVAVARKLTAEAAAAPALAAARTGPTGPTP